MDKIKTESGIMEGAVLKFVIDEAFKDTNNKHSNGAWAIFLTQNGGTVVGGFCHLLEFGGKKSKRVAKVTWSAELLSFMNGVEKAERVYYWLCEIYLGSFPGMGLQRVQSMEHHHQFIEVRGMAGCKGLCESLSSPTIGSLLDRSVMVHLVTLRECFSQGPLSRVGWIPTWSMLVDSSTKTMENVRWRRYFKTGFWYPQEAIVCRRKAAGSKSISNGWVSVFVY